MSKIMKFIKKLQEKRRKEKIEYYKDVVSPTRPYHNPNRIGVDLDTHNELKLLKTYFNAKFIGKDVKVYETLHGFHVHIFVKNNLETNLKVRECLGDDKNRLNFDWFKYRVGMPIKLDVLFSFKVSFKEGYSSHEVEVDEKNILAIPFFSKVPRGYYIEKYRRGEIFGYE